MPKITFRTGADIPQFIGPEEFKSTGAYDGVAPDEQDPDADGEGAIRVFFPGSPTEPQLFEIKLGPNVNVEAHAHYENEIIYVTQGQLRFGAITCQVGSAVSIPGRTLYAFQTGPDGAQFLNFRPIGAFGRLSKERLRELQTQDQS
jgi:hypothetical protein